MKIAIASGKGGTGKTTIAVALASYAAITTEKVDLYDCDVEEPNVNLFLKANIEISKDAAVQIPVVNLDECNSCGKCEKICQFNAIVLFNNKPLVFPDLCHSCGGCELVCPTAAITETDKIIGKVDDAVKGNINFTGGTLLVSEPMSPPLIKEVKKFATGSHLHFYDSPPGTSCPAVTTLVDCDYVVVVTEPTPFGLNDMQLLLEFLQQIKIPFGIVINRSGIGNNDVLDFCKENNHQILAEIPHDIEIARAYANGVFIDQFIQKYDDELQNILQNILKTGEDE